MIGVSVCGIFISSMSEFLLHSLVTHDNSATHDIAHDTSSVTNMWSHLLLSDSFLWQIELHFCAQIQVMNYVCGSTDSKLFTNALRLVT